MEKHIPNSSFVFFHFFFFFEQKVSNSSFVLDRGKGWMWLNWNIHCICQVNRHMEFPFLNGKCTWSQPSVLEWEGGERCTDVQCRPWTLGHIILKPLVYNTRTASHHMCSKWFLPKKKPIYLNTSLCKCHSHSMPYY